MLHVKTEQVHLIQFSVALIKSSLQNGQSVLKGRIQEVLTTFYLLKNALPLPTG